MKIRKILEETDGVSLIEVLFAALILGIALVNIALIFYRAPLYAAEIRESGIAMHAVNEEIELIRDMDFDAILALGTSFTGAGFDKLTNPNGAVNIDNPYGTADMRRVTVTVSWDTTLGLNVNKTMSTLVTRKGING